MNRPIVTRLGLACCAILLAAGLATTASTAHAQGAIRVIPQVGLYAPLSELGEVEASGSFPTQFTAKKKSTLAYGLALEFLPGRTWSLRVNGIHGSNSDVPLRGHGELGCADCATRSTVTSLTGAAVFRPLPNLILVRPYVTAGAGLKRYDFDHAASGEVLTNALMSDQNQLTGQIGAGIEINAGIARILVELSDFVSGFDAGSDSFIGDGNTQHDLFFTLGVSIGG